MSCGRWLTLDTGSAKSKGHRSPRLIRGRGVRVVEDAALEKRLLPIAAPWVRIPLSPRFLRLDHLEKLKAPRVTRVE